MWNDNNHNQQSHHHHEHYRPNYYNLPPSTYDGQSPPGFPLPNAIPPPGVSPGFLPPPGPPPDFYSYGSASPIPQFPIHPQVPHHREQNQRYQLQQPNNYPPPPGPPPPMPPANVQHYGPQVEGNQQPFFQYSQCNGRKKALCIGINYIGQDAELKGCHNDARNFAKFLGSHFGYHRNDILILLDGSSDPREIPTRENIRAAMHWLVKDAQPNDSLFFHYSGHGGQTKDLDGDEDDGYDEVIYPVDYKQTSHIVDDELHMTMVKPLPPGCRLTAIFDSCHSGSALDLPYIYSTEGKIKEPNLMLEAGQNILTAATSYMRGDMSGVIRGISSIITTATGSHKKAEEITRRTRTSPADVISWSGCKDSQTSADTVQAGAPTGAMSHAFIDALTRQPNQSYQQLLLSLRHILTTGGYAQKPQLSSSHPIDTELMFIA